ncbi:MAG: NADH-quinone oxidoreductase subunit L [Spirosomataceae bacterium]|jgi:NADH-quinone oxidoreductase subunit L
MAIFALIPLIPLIGFLINGLGFKNIPKSMIPIVAVGAPLLSFVLVIYTFLNFDSSQPQVVQFFEWITVSDFKVDFSFQIDQLSLVMLLFITGVGTLIHIYSIGYMVHDEGYGKFMSYLNLFLFSMIILVIGGNYLMMFIGWEGVGLCSYLLIGFWNQNENYSNAARKAFIMNRIGDLGFLVGIFLIIQNFGTLEFTQVFSQAGKFQSGDTVILAITLSLFIGAMGKSAQIPLFTWLPDAMAGPTPVSALIHAATMVTSGIYMVVRSNVLYSLSPFTLEFIGWIGLATALLGATIGLFQNDIKKVLAYSTVSQLGYMFIAIGVMAYSSGLFHVITHAFFKALLFLGAGSVIHAMGGEQDIRKMGGLWSKIKITSITFLIGTIAISGFPPFAGFFSKDEILAHVFEHNKIMWALAVLGSLMTSFYMFRLFFVTFKGQFRGTSEQEHHLHESPGSMTLPLIILAVLSAIGGFIGMPEVFHFPHLLNSYLAPIFEGSKALVPNFGEVSISHSTEWILMVVSIGVAIVGLFSAYFIFGKNESVPESDMEISGIKKVVYHKYYIDELYNSAFVKPIEKISMFLGSVFDSKIIDGIVNSIGKIVVLISEKIRVIQVGTTRIYVLFMTLGIILILSLGLIPQILDSMKVVFK